MPVLLVSGEKDPFGSPAEFAEYLPAIPGKVTQEWVTGGHDPRSDTRIATIVREWIARL